MNLASGFSRATVGAVTIGLIALSASPSFAAGPFESFEGNWTGTGTVSVTNGSKERLRCRAQL